MESSCSADGMAAGDCAVGALTGDSADGAGAGDLRLRVSTVLALEYTVLPCRRDNSKHVSQREDPLEAPNCCIQQHAKSHQ